MRLDVIQDQLCEIGLSHNIRSPDVHVTDKIMFSPSPKVSHSQMIHTNFNLHQTD